MRTGYLKYLDMGCRNSKPQVSQELVSSYDFWETWTYMSPEQKAQGVLTIESDV